MAEFIAPLRVGKRVDSGFAILYYKGMARYGYGKRKGTKGKLEYKKYRVRGNIKSFRDLTIYQKTTHYASEIFSCELPKNLKGRARLNSELNTAYEIAKLIPKMIAEAYGLRFVDKPAAYDKLESSMRTVDTLIAKLDFLTNAVEHQDSKRFFVELIGKYQRQRRKILNLKRAWERFGEKRK